MTAIDLGATHPIVPFTVIPRLLWPNGSQYNYISTTLGLELITENYQIWQAIKSVLCNYQIKTSKMTVSFKLILSSWLITSWSREWVVVLIVLALTSNLEIKEIKLPLCLCSTESLFHCATVPLWLSSTVPLSHFHCVFLPQCHFRGGSMGRVQGVRTPPEIKFRIYVFTFKKILAHCQWRHSLEVHPLLRKILDPPLYIFGLTLHWLTTSYLDFPLH